jgi:hypothetical protein
MMGEAAALIYTAGSNSGGSSGWFSLNPFLPGDTLTVKLYFLSAENPSPHAKLIANGTAALLVLLLLVFNLGFRYLADAFNLRLRGKTGASSGPSRARALLGQSGRRVIAAGATWVQQRQRPQSTTSEEHE